MPVNPAKIGKYEILDEKGRGGFGVVYRALNPDTQQQVAVKVVTGPADPDTLARFLQEARTTHGLRHPHIVAVYDADWDQGAPYIAMEYLEGMDLVACAKRQPPLTLLDKVRILSQVADALSFAHEHGVIHRDIKPANVMLLPGGDVKVMDFGIARALRDGATRHTRQGFHVGTPEYMAPEQLREGHDADRGTDVWAYGVLAYELLTGTHPFRRETYEATLYRILTFSEEPTPIEVLCPGIPEALERVVMLAMSKDRDLRYPDLHEIFLDLEPVLGGLREQRAREIMTDVRQRYSALGPEGAMPLVLEALRHDPSNPDAQRMRREIGQRQMEERRRRKADEYRQKAEQLITSGALAEAVDLLQSAQKASPQDSQVAALLTEARERLEQANKASSLLNRGRLLLQRKQFEEAVACLQEAAQADPGRSEVRRLLRSAEEELSRRDQEAQREDVLRRALQLAANAAPRRQDLEDALNLLDRFAAEGGVSAEADKCRTQVQAALQALDRREQITDGLRAAARSLQEGRLDQAGSILAALRGRFPDAPDIAKALAHVENRRAEQERDEAERNDRQRRAAVEQAVQEAAAARQRRAWDEGRLRLLRAQEEYGPDPALQTMLRALQSEQAAYEQRRAAVVEGVQARLRARRWDAALQELAAAERSFPEIPELAALRQQAETGLAAEHRAAEWAAAKERIVQEEQARQWDRALAAVDEALRQFPEEKAVLVSWSGRLQQAKREEMRATRLRQVQEEVAAALGRYDWRSATAIVESASGEVGGHSRNLQQQIEQRKEQYARDVKALEQAVHKTLSGGQPAEARRKVEEAERKWPGLPAAPALRERIDRRERELEEQRAAELREAERRVEAERLAQEQRQAAFREQQKAAAEARERERQRQEAEQKAREQQEAVDRDRAREQQAAEARRRAHAFDMLRSLTARAGEVHDPAQLAELLAQAQKWAAPFSNEREAQYAIASISSRLASPRAAVDAPAIQPGEAQTLPQPPQATRRPWAGLAAASIAVAAVAVAVWQFLPMKSRLVPVEVHTVPSGATVRIGDRSCVTPTCRFELPGGQYRVQAAAKGYKPAERSVTVDVRQPTPNLPIELTLEREPEVIPPPRPDPEPPSLPPAGKGTLLVAAGQGAATVSLDGNRAGVTDSRGYLRLPLAEGEYLVRVEKKGYDASPPQRVQIRGQQAVQRTFVLTPLDAQLVMRGAPAGAQVKLVAGGRTLGVVAPQGSFSARLPAGNQVIELTKDKFLPRQITIRSEPGETVSLEPRETALASLPPDAKAVATAEWERVRNTSDAAVLEEYIRKHPGGAFTSDAEGRLQDLRRRARDEAERVAKAEWDGLDKNDVTKLQDFQSRHANDEYGARAAQQMTRLQQAKAKLEPVKPDPAKPDRQTAERQAVYATLKRYEAAHANKSLGDLERVYPGLPKSTLDGYRRVFQTSGSLITMSLLPLGDPEVAGTTATVVCELKTSTTMPGAPSSQPRPRRVTVSLSRESNVWIITGIK